METVHNYVRDIFANIASGVITTDMQDTIITVNRAAERILRIQEREVQGHPLGEVLPGLGQAIAPLVDTVKQQDEMIEDHEMKLELSQGQTILRLHINPLRNNGLGPYGVAIILDDMTEYRRLEHQAQLIRQAFERYISPHVVEQLLSDPSRLRLGGERREVTIFFADARDFVAFSEKLEPETQITVLNKHLTLAAEAVLAEEGTLDKFMGDAMMAIFNAPHTQPDHVLRAVRAAVKAQRSIAEMHTHLPPDRRLGFGIGIATGLSIVGNIGADTAHSYTAVGDNVNMAYRLQSHAEPGQILISLDVYEQVKEHIIGRELGLVQFKGHSEPDMVIEVLGLR